MSSDYDVTMSTDAERETSVEPESGGVGPPQGGAAFLLAQLGGHAAGLFAERIAGLGLSPAEAGLLRMLAMSPGRSQRELADDLGMPPSRFVPFADTLEERGVIERRKNPADRRVYALHLTDRGGELLAQLRDVALEHDERLLEALSPGEREQLRGLLGRVAEQQGLRPGIHPGFRHLRADRVRRSADRSC